MVHSNRDHMKDRLGGWHTFGSRLARDGNAVTRRCILCSGLSSGCLSLKRSDGV